MISSLGWYWIWIGLFCIFGLVNGVSFTYLLNFKKRHLTPLWQNNLDKETVVLPAGRILYYELIDGRAKWVSLHRHLRIWYALFRWSGRLAFTVFVAPIAPIFLLYFLGLV
jgi:hypothetical protein